MITDKSVWSGLSAACLGHFLKGPVREGFGPSGSFGEKKLWNAELGGLWLWIAPGEELTASRKLSGKDLATELLRSSEMLPQEQESALHCYQIWRKRGPVNLKFGLNITLEWTYLLQLHEIILLTKWREDFWPTWEEVDGFRGLNAYPGVKKEFTPECSDRQLGRADVASECMLRISAFNVTLE